MDSLLENLKNNVQCSLCNDRLTEPKIMQCFHTFCKLCIKRHAELIEQVNVFECPKCKSETRLQELNSVDDLKPSLLHSRMVKVLEFVESEKVCSVSGCHPPASWHCFDCNRSLCGECKKYHSIFIKDHKLASLVEIKEEDTKLMLSRDTNCVDHVDKIAQLFCKDCEEIICLECLEHGHEGHSILTLSKHAKNKRALLSDTLEELKIREQTMGKKFKAMQEVTEEFRESGEEEKREIKKKLKETIKELQMKATELMKQIDDDVEKAEEMKVKGQSVLDQTRGAMEYMKTLIEKGTQTDVIHFEYMEYDEDILDFDDQIKKIRQLGKTFDFNEKLKKQVNSGLGNLSKIKTDHKMSSVKVEGELQATKKTKLIISTKSKTGRINHDPKDVIDVKISPEENVEIRENNMRNDGIIEVEFMAKVAGQLTAEVQVNGKHVSNSPLVMNVQPQQIRRTIRSEFQMKGIKKKSSDFTVIAVNKDNSRIAVADKSASCVYVFNSNGDLLRKYTSFRHPQGISFLNLTDLVIADNNDDRICVVNTTTGKMVKTFGSPGYSDGEFNDPHGVHVDDDGNIVVGDHWNYRVQVFTEDGDYQYQFGLMGECVPCDVITHDGRFYVSDDENHVIHVFEEKYNVPTRISKFGGYGSAAGQLREPGGLAIDNDHHLLVCDRGNNRIQKFTLDGRLIGLTRDAGYTRPKYLAVLNNGQMLVTSGKSIVIYGDGNRANDIDEDNDS